MYKTTHRTLCQDFSRGENLWTTRWLWFYDMIKCTEVCHRDLDTMKRTHRSYFPQTLLLGCVATKHQWLSYEALILMYSFSCVTMPDSGWMDTGVNSKSTRRMIRYFWSSHQVVGTCDLPSFHAPNCCDYTASFLRKAKWKPFQIIKTNSRFTTAIGHLGDSDVLDLEGMVTVEEYVC